MTASGEQRAASKERPVRMGRSLLACLLACQLAPSAARAISDNAGTTNGDFLKIPTDARGVAIGPAIVSMVQGADAVRWNPAALGSAEDKEFTTTHVQYYQGVYVENETAAYPMENSALAANLFYLSPGGGLDGRDLSGNPTGSFTFYDLVGGISYGRHLSSKEDSGVDLSAGATVKVVQEDIADSQFQNPALDLGLMLSPYDNLNLAATVRNLSTSQANFVRDIMGGASYTILDAITGALAIDYSNDAPVRLSVGGEYRIPEFGTAIRVGYQTHDPLDNSIDSAIPAFRSASIAGLTMGAGFEYHPPTFKTLRLTLDYGMAPFGALGISHTITLKVKW